MHWIRDNFSYKAIALLCSLLLWGYIKLHEDPVTEGRAVRLDIRGVADTLVATPASPQVNAIVSGPRIYVNRVTQDNLVAYADMRDRGPGDYRPEVHIEVRGNLSSIVSATAVQPRMDVHVEAKERRTIPVNVEFQGALPPGATYNVPQITPETVEAVGTESAVSKADHAIVQVRAGDPHVSGRFPILAVDARGTTINGVSLEPDTANVEATLEQTQGRRQAYVTPNVIGAPALGYRVERLWVDPQTVLLVGASNRLRDISIVSTKEVRLNGLTADLNRSVDVLAKPGITVLPPRVQLHVHVARRK